MKKLTLNLLRLYQKYLSPINFGVHTCRFEPSCSFYTYHAVERYGVLKGSLMGAWRVIRCNPLSKGGEDPVK
ncbi:membrane protein insertion efficiency factor YidD [candidate division WWE3 bacterium]|nr:membrane protein insertion efficiency factor YidD [candidate division WWE3 bacterium]MBT7350287.1 membrane protein insertion efficiency factor YidD [candidate division WWE3 bacterium]